MQRLPHQLGPGVCWQELQRWLLAVEEHLGHCQEKGAGRSRRTPAGGSSALGGGAAKVRWATWGAATHLAGWGLRDKQTSRKGVKKKMQHSRTDITSVLHRSSHSSPVWVTECQSPAHRKRLVSVSPRCSAAFSSQVMEVRGNHLGLGSSAELVGSLQYGRRRKRRERD